MSLRTGTIVVLTGIVAVVLVAAHRMPGIVGFGCWGAILLIAVLVERFEYRPRVDRGAHDWNATGERFRDPASGEIVEVVTRPNGERDYRRVDSGDPP